MENTQNNTNVTKTNPKDFFMYSGALLALLVSAISFVTLVFNLIDVIYPDTSFYDYYSGSIRFAFACIVVVFPLYLGLTWSLRKDVILNPAKKDFWLKRWGAYSAIFVTGIITAGDLISLINTFLSGELTSRFLWKTLTVFLVSGAIFAYYLFDLKRKSDEDKTLSKVLILASLLIVFGTTFGSFIVIGSPAKARALNFDSRRVDDLSSIEWQVISRWQEKGVLPLTLKEVEGDAQSTSYFNLPLDPETKTPYSYKKIDTLLFELCATFSYPTPERLPNPRWTHDTGLQCFTHIIDTNTYPVRKF